MTIKKSLSIVDQITIKKPCHESWEQMTGNQQKKHCASCQLSVTNLSAYTKGHAEKILAQQAGQKMCVRYTVTPRGKILFKESIWSKAWKSAAIFLGTICAAIGVSSAAIAENITDQNVNENPEENVRLMGEAMAIETPTPSPTIDENKELMGDVAVPNKAEGTTATESVTMGRVSVKGK